MRSEGIGLLKRTIAAGSAVRSELDTFHKPGLVHRKTSRTGLMVNLFVPKALLQTAASQAIQAG